MSSTKTIQLNTLASVALLDAYTDFVLSRQAMNVSPFTMQFYRFTTRPFVNWLAEQGISEPAEVTARYVRQYLAMLVNRGLKDTTCHDYARAIKTLMRFWKDEKYIPDYIKFEMPQLAKKRLPSLTKEQLQTVLNACNVRDCAIVMFMADSGLRRSEVCKLNWGDVDMQTGLVKVIQGKGKKDRSAVIGATTRRALLRYRRTLELHDAQDVLFQTEDGTRFSGGGLYHVYRRLRLQTGIHCTPHAMRRTMTILLLRNGADPLDVQNLGGWEDSEMVNRYAQMEDIDLVRAHKGHSPIDNLK